MTHQIIPLPPYASALTQLHDETDPDEVLEYEHSSDFAEGYVRHQAAIEALRCLGEDSYVQVDDKTAAEIEAGVEAARADIRLLFRVVQKVAALPSLKFNLEELTLQTKRHAAKFLQRTAPDGFPGFLLSNKQVRELPIIDDSLADPRYAGGVIDAFVATIEEIRKTRHVTCLTFVEKSLGPVGALAMLGSIVRATNLPACIYREKSWSKTGAFSGHTPTEADSTIIVYDLILKGTGIKNSAQRLSDRFGASVAGAIVLHSFDPSIGEIALTGGERFAVYPLHVVDPDHQSTNPGRVPRPAVNAGDHRSLSERKDNMTASARPNWRHTISDYGPEEKIALAFTVEMIDQAISAIWNEPEFKGMPVESPNGSVLFVPKEAVPLLRARGIDFVEQKIRGAASNEQRARHPLLVEK